MKSSYLPFSDVFWQKTIIYHQKVQKLPLWICGFWKPDIAKQTVFSDSAPQNWPENMCRMTYLRQNQAGSCFPQEWRTGGCSCTTVLLWILLGFLVLSNLWHVIYVSWSILAREIQCAGYFCQIRRCKAAILKNKFLGAPPRWSQVITQFFFVF